VILDGITGQAAPLHFFERRPAGLAKLGVAPTEELCATQPESGDPRRARCRVTQIAVEQRHGCRDLSDKPGRPLKGPVERCRHS
jgi:hypothetical protein